MRKQVFGRILKRDTNERKALFKSLIAALILNERISTTEAKAKSVRSQVEKLVTLAKNDGTQAQRSLQGYLEMPIVKKLVSDVAPRFAKRPGGYTRIIKIGNRFGDNAKMVLLEWVEKKPEVVKAEVISGESKQVTAETEVKEAEVQVSKKEKITSGKTVKKKVKKEKKEIKEKK